MVAATSETANIASDLTIGPGVLWLVMMAPRFSGLSAEPSHFYSAILWFGTASIHESRKRTVRFAADFGRRLEILPGSIREKSSRRRSSLTKPQRPFVAWPPWRHVEEHCRVP